MSTFGKCSGGGRRSAQREPAPLIATLSTVTRSDRAIVADLSATGVRLVGERLPQKGELLEVSIESMRAFGIVVWSEGAMCGIAFDEPLSPIALSKLRHQVIAMAGLPPHLKAALDDWTTGLAR